MRYLSIPAFCLLLLAITTSTAAGQQNFQPGTVTKINGEPQIGLIDYRNWRKNPRSINFKASNGKVEELTYRDLASFEVKRPDKKLERFKRAIVQVDVSPTEAGKLDDNPLPIFKTDTLLLMVLVSGDMDLYQLVREDDGLHFFYGRSGSDEISELVHKEYVPKNTNQINVNYQYRKQLLDIVPDCETMNSKDFASLKYKVFQMIKAAKAINQCLGGPPNYVFEDEKQKIEFYLNGGLNSIFYDIESGWEALDKTEFNTYLGPTGGIGLNWLVPRTQGKLLVSIEGYYFQFKAKGLYTTPFISLGDDHYTTNIAANLMGSQAGLEWRFYKGAFTPYLKSALTSAWLLKSSQSGLLETHYDDGRKAFRYNYLPYESFREYTQGMMFSLGVILPNNHWRLELRHYFTNGISVDLQEKDKLQSLVILAGYKF